MSTNAPAQNMTSSRQSISYHTVEIQGLKIFYREAGPANAPTVLLLHRLSVLIADVGTFTSPPGRQVSSHRSRLSRVRQQQRALPVELRIHFRQSRACDG